MAANLDDLLRRSIIFRRLSPEDRQRLAAVASVREYEKGAALFNEGDDSAHLFTIVNGRVKVFKTTARGTDVILEIFGAGDSVGAVAVYEARAYPASGVTLEPTTCLLVRRYFHGGMPVPSAPREMMRKRSASVGSCPEDVVRNLNCAAVKSRGGGTRKGAP